MKKPYKIDKNRQIQENNAESCCSLNRAFIVLVIVLFLIVFTFYRDSVTEQQCLGDKCQEFICNAVNAQQCTGTLCMEICVRKGFYLESCSANEYFNADYRFFDYDIDTHQGSIICNVNLNEFKNNDFVKLFQYPEEDLEFSKFENSVIDLIQSKVDYMHKTIKIIDRLLDLADVNRDERLNLAEAKTLWSLLTNKNTFYMLIMAGYNYIPKIQSFCGNLVEIERMDNYYLFSIEHDSILPTLFPKSYKWLWPDWKYRCKIAMGILEFFLDASSFNPNDEFGKNSLYLCSPIATSFGHTYVYEAKLLNYKELLSGLELENILKTQSCNYDTDCYYTPSCIAKCDLKTHKCSGYLAEPQIVSVCKFINSYITEDVSLNGTNDELKMQRLKRVLDRCLNLGQIKRATFQLYLSTSSSVSSQFENVNLFENSTYALEHSLITHELKSSLWSFIKFTRDPKPKKIEPKPITTTTANSNA